MDPEYETKPQNIKNKEQFEKMAGEMLSAWKEYKKLDARMKLLDASTKKYMIDNDMDKYRCDRGIITIVDQNRKVLDREIRNLGSKNAETFLSNCNHRKDKKGYGIILEKMNGFYRLRPCLYEEYERKILNNHG